MQEFFPKMEGISGNMGWHRVLLLRGLGSRGPKDEVFFCGGARSLAEQERRYRHRQNRKGLLWCGLKRGDKLLVE